MLLKHSFGDLDAAIKEDSIAQKMQIKTGAEYGLLWAAYALREPYKKLPYLFFYGDQDCGKSTYHEAFEFLMTKGFVSANNALRSQSDFNGELAGAIVASIEEIDLMRTRGAYSKIKDWVTSEWLSIRQMRTDTYSILNTLHFVQVANDPSFCPIFPGDTRITMIFVPPLLDRLVPRDHMREYLKEEAPHFLWTLLNVKLPPPESRLRLPVIVTDKKHRAAKANQSPLEEFLSDHAYAIPGAKVPFIEFYTRFSNGLARTSRAMEQATGGERASAPIRLRKHYRKRTMDRKPLLGRWNSRGTALDRSRRKVEAVMDRPLTHDDLCAIAEELIGTDDDLSIGMGTLGIDPFLFEDGEVERWLKEIGLVQDPDSGIWRNRHGF